MSRSETTRPSRDLARPPAPRARMRRPRVTSLASTAALAAVLLVLPARAVASGDAPVRVGGAAFPAWQDAGGAHLKLQGAGLFRWGWFVKVYAAAHYLDATAPGAPPEADVARRLEIACLVNVSAAELARATERLLARAHGPEVMRALGDRLARLRAAYVGLRPGDRYALTYTPGRGTEVSLNGRALARVEGADFARAFFSIWLGSRPVDGGLRDALLGAGASPAVRARSRG